MENPEQSVSVHDKYQFEVKFTYPVDPRQKEMEYHVECCMFIPQNLCVNKSTYSKEEFYSDLLKYTRFKTPVTRIGEMDSGENAPLLKLEEAMRNLVSARNVSGLQNEFNDSLKMFCSIFKSSLRDEEAFIEKNHADPAIMLLIEKYLQKSAEGLSKFRALREIFQDPHLSVRYMKMYQLADEFLSLTICKYHSRLIMFIKSSEFDLLRKDAYSAIEKETSYRQAWSYGSTASENSDNEEFVYREGALKKIMASVLFLKKETVKEGRLLEQFSFGIAAGLAMAFATGVAVLFRCRLDEFSLTFFAVLVISYMFKDRIKELSRMYLSECLRKYLYDLRTDLYNSFGNKMGFTKESCSFVSENSLPAQIAGIRNKDFLSELDNGVLGEDVIYYKKQIKLFSSGCRKIFANFPVDGVVDIFRFDVRKFLEKMDNPAKELYIPSNGEIIPVKSKRVYHVTVIFRYGMKDHEDSFHKIRLILCRNGIKRIENF